MSNAINDQDNHGLEQNTFTVQWIGFQTIVIKEIWRFLRIWVQTLLPPVITMTLYFIIFGNLIGKRIGEMGGLDYMQFIAPGLIMMSIINNSFGNVVSSFYSARFQNCIEEILVSPLHNALMVMGFVTGGVIRGLAVGLIVTGIAMLFTNLQIHNLGITITVASLSAILFSLLGFMNALFARSFDDVSIVPTFFLAPLTYLGGVFYSISLLPEFWQGVSKINPILYMVNTFRYGMLGVSDIPVTYALIVLMGVIALTFTIIMALINRGVGIRK